MRTMLTLLLQIVLEHRTQSGYEVKRNQLVGSLEAHGWNVDVESEDPEDPAEVAAEEEHDSPHVHDWSPWPHHMAQYRCGDCGASGYRAGHGPSAGQIVPHKVPKEERDRITARPTVGRNEAGHRLPASSTGKRER